MASEPPEYLASLLACPEDDPVIPDGFCPVCTKDLETDGWCFECRKFPRPENERG